MRHTPAYEPLVENTTDVFVNGRAIPFTQVRPSDNMDVYYDPTASGPSLSMSLTRHQSQADGSTRWRPYSVASKA